MTKLFALLVAVSLPASALADDPQITDAVAQQTADSWRISVTLRHPDTGWGHYADGWAETTYTLRLTCTSC
ncbi:MULTISPECIES: hypothetical protein [unclassified Phaeobacter]|uniref:hypothetical protein n=1 Tax=unclassified Phaeobacter TaxID=2621772 RepID=UPI003A8515A0